VKEQVVVGKLYLDRDKGSFSIFALPGPFGWLRQFSAEDLAEFFKELLEALNKGLQSNDLSPVTEVIEDWKATAEILAEQDTVQSLIKGLKELEAGEGVSWESLRRELNPEFLFKFPPQHHNRYRIYHHA